MSAGENGEKLPLIGEDSGMIVEESGGERGRSGGGVTDTILGVAQPEDGCDAAGDDSRGEYWP